MIPQDIIDQLRSFTAAEDFTAHSAKLTAAWSSAGAGVESVEPILRFMEEHPTIDFGTPGPLVHFVERFYGQGYEKKLVESIQRKPILHTIWMLNRIINGTKAQDLKQQLITTLERAKFNPLTDEKTLLQINHFLERL